MVAWAGHWGTEEDVQGNFGGNKNFLYLDCVGVYICQDSLNCKLQVGTFYHMSIISQ